MVGKYDKREIYKADFPMSPQNKRELFFTNFKLKSLFLHALPK